MQACNLSCGHCYADEPATCARLYPQVFVTPAWQHELDACRLG